MPTKTIKLEDRRVELAKVKVGNEGDNNAEHIKFVLPERLDDATVFLFLSIDGYSDVVRLDNRIYTPSRTHTQYPGRWTAYLQAVADDDVVWHSDPFQLQIGNLPPTGQQISQQYPTAIEEALRAAATLAGMDARAETLPAGSDATVRTETTEDGTHVLVFGIPRGADGGGDGGGTANVTINGEPPDVNGNFILNVLNDVEIAQLSALIT